jgi:hypothetical protein
VAIGAFGVAGSLPLALCALSAAGGADAVSGVFRNAIWSRTIKALVATATVAPAAGAA